MPQIRISEFSESPINNIIKDLSIHSLDKKFLKEANAIVFKYIDNSNFNNNIFAKELNHSKSFVYKKIKALTGKSISEFIRTIRLQTSEKYLKESDLTIKEISYLVGFKHPQNFSDHFTSLNGISPLNYRKKHREDTNT